jgi:hypothetical protein
VTVTVTVTVIVTVIVIVIVTGGLCGALRLCAEGRLRVVEEEEDMGVGAGARVSACVGRRRAGVAGVVRHAVAVGVTVLLEGEALPSVDAHVRGVRACAFACAFACACECVCWTYLPVAPCERAHARLLLLPSGLVPSRVSSGMLPLLRVRVSSCTLAARRERRHPAEEGLVLRSDSLHCAGLARAGAGAPTRDRRRRPTPPPPTRRGRVHVLGGEAAALALAPAPALAAVKNRRCGAEGTVVRRAAAVSAATGGRLGVPTACLSRCEADEASGPMSSALVSPRRQSVNRVAQTTACTRAHVSECGHAMLYDNIQAATAPC